MTKIGGTAVFWTAGAAPATMLGLDRPACLPYLTYLLNTMQTTDPLSATLAALADPTRRAILERLSSGAATVNEIAEPFDISLPAISRHLKVLESAGLISRGREAQWRPCQLEAASLKRVDEWLEQYRRFWTGSFDKMDAYIAELKKKDKRT
jgi:DNA-binding transcriptional ArsR family regulator